MHQVPSIVYTRKMDYNELALTLHKQYKGKITTRLRDETELDRTRLSAYYSPGVGAVSQATACSASTIGSFNS